MHIPIGPDPCGCHTHAQLDEQEVSDLFDRVMAMFRLLPDKVFEPPPTLP